MSFKLQVNVSDELVEKIDIIAKALGVSRSSLCAIWIGQGALGYEKAFDTLERMGNNSVSEFNNIVKGIADEDTKD